MVQVTGLTKARMLLIEAASIVSGVIVGDDLILTKHDGSTINAGDVRGPQGIQGIPGPTAPNLITNAMLNAAASEPGADSALSTYTPTITVGGVSITHGTGATRQGQKIRIGKLCYVVGNIVLGTSPSFGAGGAFGFSLPHAPASNPTMTAVGSMRISGLTSSHIAYFSNLILNNANANFGVRYASAYPSSATDVQVGSVSPQIPIANTRYEFALLYEMD